MTTAIQLAKLGKELLKIEVEFSIYSDETCVKIYVKNILLAGYVYDREVDIADLPNAIEDLKNFLAEYDPRQMLLSFEGAEDAV